MKHEMLTLDHTYSMLLHTSESGIICSIFLLPSLVFDVQNDIRYKLPKYSYSIIEICQMS